MTLIQSLRASDNLQSLILLMGDLDAQKVVVAWTLYRPRWKDREIKKNEDADLLLSEEWKKLDVDYDRLVQLSGLPYRTAAEIFDRMKEARIIYPNGQASENAMRVLRSEVGAHLQAKGPRR